MAFTGFAFHRRDEVSEHGSFGFNLTGVEYAHDGIKGLLYNVPVPQQQWDVEVASGTFTTAYVFDSATSRVPLRITCTATGTANAYVRFKLDRDFGSFPTGAFSITTRKNQACTLMAAALLKGGATDSTIDGTIAASIEPTLDNTWETFTFTPGSAYTPSDWLTVKLVFTADTIGDYAEFSDLFMQYRTARGNV